MLIQWKRNWGRGNFYPLEAGNSKFWTIRKAEAQYGMKLLNFRREKTKYKNSMRGLEIVNRLKFGKIWIRIKINKKYFTGKDNKHIFFPFILEVVPL